MRIPISMNQRGYIDHRSKNSASFRVIRDDDRWAIKNGKHILTFEEFKEQYPYRGYDIYYRSKTKNKHHKFNI